MKILITGIHGFVGSNIVEYFMNRHEIYGLDIISPKKKGVIKTFSWKEIEEGNIPDVDAIIHLAGKAHDTKNQSDSQIYFKINTELTKKIFDYFLKSKSKKFIFFSTVKAVTDKVEGDFLTEDITPKPIGPYGESKIKAEEYIQNHFDFISADEKQQVYIVRPCMIHGPGNKGNLNLLYNIISKGIPWPLGAFENKRTFTSIENLCFFINGLLSKDITSGIYHIADNEALSTNELIEIICQSLNKKTHIWHINKNLIEMIAKIGTKLHLPLNNERLQKLTENYVVSNNKIKTALGLEHLPLTAKEGLKITIESFKK